MSEWISINEKTDWEKMPNKYELLYQNGKINKIIIYGGDEECYLRMEGDGIGVATHWRSIKK